MRRIVTTFILVGLMLMAAVPAFASDKGPCVGDHTGREYAQGHIVPLAHAGILGQGHKPGSHKGFSICK